MTDQKDYFFEKNLNFGSLISHKILFKVYIYKQFLIVIRDTVLKAAWSRDTQHI